MTSPRTPRRSKPQPKRAKRPSRKPAPKRPRLLYRLFYWAAVAGAWAMVGLLLFGLYIAHDLPNVNELQPPKAEPSIVVLARDGSTIATYGDVHGEWLAFEEFPAPLLAAVIATEDRRFFTHVGFDLQGLARAGFRNLVSGRIVEGGSTITQQLAKNMFLSSERTYRRKLQELMLAFWLEMKLSKQEILTLYLNRMYFGSRAYGVDAAAHTYFGHGARHLSVAEAAMIVGLLKAPSALAPSRNYDAALRRSHDVIGAMVAVDALTPTEAEIAMANPPRLVRSMTGADSRYFADWVVERLPRSVTAEGVPLVVQTTLDPQAQVIAERALRQSLNSDGIPGNISQGAAVVMTTDGSVIAMVGGRSYGESQFNRAVQARRQPGSAFKLFVYVAAIDAGIDPDSTMRDTPVVFGKWRPVNYGGNYLGEVSLRQAFAQSINTVAVKLSERVDRDRVIRIAHIMGIKSPLASHPSIALGTSEVNLLELTAAYGVVASGGYQVEPDPIVEIRSAKGEVIYRRLPKVASRLIAPHANDMIRELLVQAVESGTGRAARWGGPAAGKTGTSQDFRDAWFIGMSGDFVTGVWLGNDDETPMNKVTGGGAPAKLWGSIMRGLAQGMVIEPAGRPKMRPEPPQVVENAGEDNEGLFSRLRARLRALDGE